MLQAEHHRFHRHAALEEDTGGREQDQASQQAHHQRPVVGILPMDLARFRGQPVRQRAAGECHPTPPLPGPDQTGSRRRRRHTEPIVARFTRFRHGDHGDRPIRGAGGREPPLLHPRPLQTVAPGPATTGGRALARHCMPDGRQEILAPERQLPQPLPRGEGAQEPRGQVLVPDAHLGPPGGDPAAPSRPSPVPGPARHRCARVCSRWKRARYF
jgi:hypothetical protein